MTPIAPPSSEVLVIGGGPAGLAAAIAARMKGLAVTVADAAHPPIDKACGEGILPAGVEALRRLGVELDAGDGAVIRGIRFLSGEASVEARFSSGSGVAVRRTRLHELLAQRAAAVGVRLLWGTSMRGAFADRGGWVVGADGQPSLIRKEAHLEAGRAVSTRFGSRRHYGVAPWTDMVEVYWGTRGQVYVTPVGSDEIGVALLSRDRRCTLDDALREFPGLERRLRCARLTSGDRGAVTMTRRLRRVVHRRTALVGDASGSVDAITGEGLSLAFRQALALGDALAAGDLEMYQSAHRRLVRESGALSRVLLLLDRLPWLRRMALHGLAWDPSLFSRLLARHAPGPAV